MLSHRQVEKTCALMSNHGQTWVTFIVDFSYSLNIIWHEPLEITSGTPLFVMIIFKISQRRVCIVSSPNCMSQCTMVNPLQYQMLYTSHAIVVKSFKCLTWSNIIQKISMSIIYYLLLNIESHVLFGYLLFIECILVESIMLNICMQKPILLMNNIGCKLLETPILKV